MLPIYDKARTTFGIKNGFVEDQIEEIYAFLKRLYQSENLELFTIEYFKTKVKTFELEKAYSLLKKPFSHYLINSDIHLKEEQMVEEISKVIYDYQKKDKRVDKYFIAKLVEIMVSAKGLHQYITDIEFHKYSKRYLALYDDKTLKVYKKSIEEDAEQFISKHNYYMYYKVVEILRHEVEHANQEKMVEEQDSILEAQLLKICFAIFPKYHEYIFQLPLPIFFIWNIAVILHAKKDFKKYIENWEYAPQERMAEIRANALVLTLLEQEKLQSIQEIFESDMLFALLQGYDKPLGPTDFYFSELGFSQKWEKVEKLSFLSLEEKLLFGFPLTLEEVNEVKQNKKKVLSKMQKIC